MATTMTVNSNYSGSASSEIIGAAFKEADTISKNLVTVMPDIDFQISLRKIAYTDGRVDYTCGFTPTGAVTLSERLLTPKKLKNEQTICKEDLRNLWSSASMGFSAHNENLPKDIEAALLNEILMDTAEATDLDIWQGVAATTGRIGGFIELFTADAAVIKANNGITAINAAVSESNVEAVLKAALAAIPVTLRRKSLNVMVSANVWQAYMFYLTSKGIADNGDTSEKRMGFAGYTLVELQDLPDNTIVIAEPKNLVFATGLEQDFNEIALVDEDSIGLLTGQVRGKIVYSGGVGYYNSNEIVYLLSTTA